MKKLLCAGAMVAAASSVLANTLSISLGSRETNTAAAIGADGGTSGGIEWVNLDGQTLTLDGTWQRFTFDLGNDPATAFAGATANGDLGDSGAILAGTIEHLRILNSGGVSAPITLWIDDIANTVDPAGPAPATTTTFGTFEGYADGTEAIFQEPSFSGSTSANLLAGSVSGVDSSMALSGAASYRSAFQFVDSTTTRWVRLTTFATPNQPNPTIKYPSSAVTSSTVSLWIKGIPEPTSLLLLGLPAVSLLRRRG